MLPLSTSYQNIHRAPEYVTQALIELQGEIGKSTVTARDFNTSVSVFG